MNREAYQIRLMHEIIAFARCECALTQLIYSEYDMITDGEMKDGDIIDEGTIAHIKRQEHFVELLKEIQFIKNERVEYLTMELSDTYCIEKIWSDREK